MLNIIEAFQLPDNLRGKKINSEKIIPTVCNIKNMLKKLEMSDWNYSRLEQWEKQSYKHYYISKIQGQLFNASEEERIQIIRKHILHEDFETLGASPFDIYIVAYVAENIGIGKEEFTKFCINKRMAGTPNSAGAIYNVGKGDGIYLGILNKDGTVKDWDFMNKWVNISPGLNGKVKLYNKLVRDKIPQVIEKQGNKYDIHIAKREEHFELLEKKLQEEVAEFLQDKNLEELADIMEVLFGLADNMGYSEEELLKKRDEKREERGGFKEGIVLERVYE